MSEIKPALTAEEWAVRKRPQYMLPDRPRIKLRRDGSLDMNLDDVSNPAEPWSCAEMTIPPEDRHVVAALALHGLPEGFTWEDVDRLYVTAEWLENFPNPIQDFDSEMLRDLADRIAALLPPREP